jgi:hypothetical protein
MVNKWDIYQYNLLKNIVYIGYLILEFKILKVYLNIDIDWNLLLLIHTIFLPWNGREI